MQNQLSVGLDKMQEAAEAAEEMGKILAVQAKGVEKATNKARIVMNTVQVALHEADKVCDWSVLSLIWVKAIDGFSVSTKTVTVTVVLRGQAVEPEIPFTALRSFDFFEQRKDKKDKHEKNPAEVQFDEHVAVCTILLCWK